MSTPLAEQLTDIHNQLGILELEIAALDAEIQDLAQSNKLDGKTWYKNGTYLYLVHAADQRKEYIGADPEKQKAALQRLDLHKTWKAKRDKRDRLNRRFNNILSNIHTAWTMAIDAI